MFAALLKSALRNTTEIFEIAIPEHYPKNNAEKYFKTLSNFFFLKHY